MILFVVYHILEENARVFFCFLQKCGFVVLVRWFEVCKTSKLLLRQEQTFHEMESLKGGLAAERMPPRASKKAHEVCCPEWGKLSERKVPKGFNFVSAKVLFGCADSRFVEPRNSLQGRTDLFFSLVRKERGVPQRFANLWTPGTIQISARFEILAEMTGHHHVTGHTGHCNLPGYRR